MSSLAARLNAERNRKFVGRVGELEIFQRAITSGELPFNILYIYGPGGVGKTALLNQFRRLCCELKIQCLYLEARNLESAPQSFLRSLSSIMGLSEYDCPISVLAKRQERQVIFIDTYENITPLDEWLREEFLPQLSLDTLIVIAERNSPSAAWRSDPGWQTLIHTLSLRNLSPEESLIYLTGRHIPTAQHQAILNFTHGFPLALSLIADVFAQGQEISLNSDHAPNIVKTLLERFISEVPTSAHRLALQACAVVRVTTEALLTQMLCLPDTHQIHDIFEWLRGLSFVETSHFGLFPHDLAREVLIADLRWRNPDLYVDLHHRSRNYYTVRLGQSQGEEKHRVLFDYMFLHRDNADIRMRFTWQEHSSLLTDSLQPGDKEAILAMVRHFEGEESAKIAAHWLQKQPQNVVVFRDSQALPAGFTIMVALQEASSEDIQVDAVVDDCWRYLQNHAPLRLQEGATVFRFWMARDTYQLTSPTQSLIFVNFVQYFQKTPALAYTFLVCAEPDAWASMLTYFDMTRLSEVDFTVEARKYGVYGHDWRIVSPEAWRELLARREIAASETATSNTPTSQPLLVLSQPDFIEAVQDALRNFTRSDVLQKNSLLRSHLVDAQVTGNDSTKERVTTLQNFIKQAAESLQTSPRDEKLYRALHRTYLNPALTQEQAAELLDLPFSTYRRHLKAGMVRVAEILWQREIN
ncbi:MAG: ATP-binding protein [Scytonematopsis contorta HA4267-MV1]|jgi:hypothetical protein|nr:ATP-binding protein [Scytonematopsis contorta HA4267-MV1]